MDKKAVAGARDIFEIMQKARNGIEIARNPRETRIAWLELISAAGRIFTKLEQGAKASGASSAWFGSIKHERSKDPLLAYCLHARNCHEHGIDDVTGGSQGEIHFTGPGPRAILYYNDAPLDDEPYQAPTPVPSVQYWGNEREMYSAIGSATDHRPFVTLSAVKDRGVTYHPPEEHKGQKLSEPTPKVAGTLLCSYCEAMLAKAEALSE